MKRFKRLVPWLILLILLGFCLYPSVVQVRIGDDTANSIKQIVLATHAYHDAYKKLPPAVARDKEGNPLYSWRVLILPFVEQQSLFNQFKLDEPWDSPDNITLLEKMPSVFTSFSLAADSKPGMTFFQTFVGPGTAFEREGLTLKDFPDGLDKTLFVIEAGEAVPWTKPVDLEYDPNKPLPALKAHHTVPVFVLNWPVYQKPCFKAGFGDGRVYTLPYPINEQLLRGYITRNGGESVQFPPPQ